MRRSLVMLEIDHIKEYVFGTGKLKEIRGASSLLDRLNRFTMKKKAEKTEAFEKKCIIYANGGSGVFLINEAEAEDFGKKVQKAFGDATGGSASVTYVVQELPKDAPEDLNLLLNNYGLLNTLELMRFRLREVKDCPPDFLAFPSHPLMKTCDACGIEYATPETKETRVHRDSGEENELYCASCLRKRKEDVEVKEYIEGILGKRGRKEEPDTENYLWNRLLMKLSNLGYEIPGDVQRPSDLNVFSSFTGGKDYIGLIYADANGMGKKLDGYGKLVELGYFANTLDHSIDDALCSAIEKHLKIKDHWKPTKTLPTAIFPFDILLLGGDDVVLVTPASVALDVANTIAKEFHGLMKAKVRKRDETEEDYTLSVGVILAPIKYPFRLLNDLAEKTLKFAKREGSRRKEEINHNGEYGSTRINFMTVTGSTSLDFDKVYKSLCSKGVKVNGQTETEEADLYATLRPYDPVQLDKLLTLIREGYNKALGRTKLHQLREAVLKMNLSTSVGEGLAMLRNWNKGQREYVLQQVYALGGFNRVQHSIPEDPTSYSFRVTFPWFADGKTRDNKKRSIYRTPLLDFVDLYDFVSREGVDSSNE